MILSYSICSSILFVHVLLPSFLNSCLEGFGGRLQPIAGHFCKEKVVNNMPVHFSKEETMYTVRVSTISLVDINERGRWPTEVPPRPLIPRLRVWRQPSPLENVLPTFVHRMMCPPSRIPVNRYTKWRTGRNIIWVE